MQNKNKPIKTIRLSADFQKLSKSRRRITLAPWLFAKVLENPVESRVGWSLSRSVGGAVVRNKIKRWIRNFLAQNAELVAKPKQDVSLVFNCRPGSDLKKLSRKELDAVLERLFKLLEKN